jgi:GNAT superfamily N-acetyltransferase
MNATVTLERPAAEELADLFVALGWGPPSRDVLESSIRAYTATICARNPGGRLVGYASVFSDGCLTTMLGEFLVHPGFQRRRIGKAMMRLVEQCFPLAPIYIQALGDSVGFYQALGFRVSSAQVSSMFKRPSERRSSLRRG